MTSDPNPVINVPHTLCVQYPTTGLDGTTPSKAFSIDPGNDDFIVPNAQGIFVVPQAGKLGLIDPDQDVGGSRGDRFIPWFEVCVQGPTTVTISLVDAEAPDKDLLVLEQDVAVDVDKPLYRKRCFRVPQGGLIKIVAADQDVAAKVRLRIIVQIQEECDENGDDDGDTRCCDCHSFSGQRVVIGAGDLYVGFSAGAPFGGVPPNFQFAGGIGILAFGPNMLLAAQKCVCRDGRFVGAVMSASQTIDDVEVFVEVSTAGVGMFIRTIVASGVTIGTGSTVIPFVPDVAFSQGDCVRFGIRVVESSGQSRDLKIELELEYN